VPSFSTSLVLTLITFTGRYGHADGLLSANQSQKRAVKKRGTSTRSSGKDYYMTLEAFLAVHRPNSSPPVCKGRGLSGFRSDWVFELGSLDCRKCKLRLRLAGSSKSSPLTGVSGPSHMVFVSSYSLLAFRMCLHCISRTRSTCMRYVRPTNQV
jgi:hypothetical protein